jgi:electron transfer flavoprotein alpha subunit
MKVHIVLNKDVPGNLLKINGLIKDLDLNLENMDTIIIGGDGSDEDSRKTLTEIALTNSVIFLYLEKYNVESILNFLSSPSFANDFFIFGSNIQSQELCVRLATRLKISSMVNCKKLEVQDNEIFAYREVYSGHLLGRFSFANKPFAISIHKGNKEVSYEYRKNHSVNIYKLQDMDEGIQVIETNPIPSEKSLEKAKFIVVAGRGMRSKNKTKDYEKLAEDIGADFGVSRPVVMNAWMPMEKLVGVSGVEISPDICIAVATSGAPALYSGIEKSKYIIGINIDKDASIIKKSDVAIIGDGEEVLKKIRDYINE